MKFFKIIKSLFSFSNEESKSVSQEPAETGLHLRDEKTIDAIVKSLQQLGLVGKGIIGIKLFVLPKNQVDELAYNNLLQTDGFKTELQRQLDNKFVLLSDNWSFAWEIIDIFPQDCTIINDVLAIRLLDKGSVKHKEATITTLIGKTWESTCDLKPTEDIINIGRGKSPELASGRIQVNQIAFIDPDEEELDTKTKDINLHVSRFHCYIKYDLTEMKYSLHLAKLIFQSGHDTKILRGSGNKEQKIDVNNDRIAYPLESGDQIQFNKKAILEFQFKV